MGVAKNQRAESTISLTLVLLQAPPPPPLPYNPFHMKALIPIFVPDA